MNTPYAGRFNSLSPGCRWSTADCFCARDRRGMARRGIWHRRSRASSGCVQSAWRQALFDRADSGLRRICLMLTISRSRILQEARGASQAIGAQLLWCTRGLVARRSAWIAAHATGHTPTTGRRRVRGYFPNVFPKRPCWLPRSSVVGFKSHLGNTRAARWGAVELILSSPRFDARSGCPRLRECLTIRCRFPKPAALGRWVSCVPSVKSSRRVTIRHSASARKYQAS